MTPRYLLYLVFLAGMVLFLLYALPYAARSADNKVHLAYLVLLAVLVGGGVFGARDMPKRTLLKQAGAWLAILFLLLAAYSYREEWLHSRLVADLIPNRPRVSAEGDVSFRAQRDGHFYVEASVNGVPLLFMVDTGASDVILTADDANALGLPLRSLEYSRAYQTANGMVMAAPIDLEYIDIGGIQVDRVGAAVNASDMGTSLLGMSFLRRLKGFRMEGDTLTISP